MGVKFANVPNFRDPEWLRSHAFDILRFYYPHCINTTNGGFYQSFRDDGKILDENTQHLVGTARFVFIFSVGSMLGGPREYLEASEFGLHALMKNHADTQYGGYLWLLNGAETDSTKHAYGHAFALLAAAISVKAGVSWARSLVYEIFDTLEEHFWDQEFGLYRDEITGDWKQVSPYRGQNANMHMCEAMLVAFEATNDRKFLNRAYELAANVVKRLASQTGGWIWEHYNSNWEVDWQYNKSDPQNLLRTYGYVMGHFLEWSKLLMILERYKRESWMLERAEQLYRVAVENAWDDQHGGLFYTLDPQKHVLDQDKYYWVMAEGIAASALLGNRTNDPVYWRLYEDMWVYAYKYFVDHKYGGWYRILSHDNVPYSDIKSPPPKTDYHSIGACYEVLRSFGTPNL